MEYLLLQTGTERTFEKHPPTSDKKEQGYRSISSPKQALERDSKTLGVFAKLWNKFIGKKLPERFGLDTHVHIQRSGEHSDPATIYRLAPVKIPWDTHQFTFTVDSDGCCRIYESKQNASSQDQILNHLQYRACEPLQNEGKPFSPPLKLFAVPPLASNPLISTLPNKYNKITVFQ